MIDIVHAAEIAKDAAHAVEATASANPIGTFGLNLKLFIAQLVNFAIVLLVLWKWVYKPLLKILRERTDTIEKSLADAKQIEQDRLAADETTAAQIKQAKEEARAIIAQSAEKAEALALAGKEKATQEVEQLVAQAKAQIASERTAMKEELKAETMTLAVAVAQKILQEKIDTKADATLIAKAVDSVK